MKTLGSTWAWFRVGIAFHTYSKSVFGTGSACTRGHADAPNPDAHVADSDHDTAQMFLSLIRQPRPYPPDRSIVSVFRLISLRKSPPSLVVRSLNATCCPISKRTHIQRFLFYLRRYQFTTKETVLLDTYYHKLRQLSYSFSCSLFRSLTPALSSSPPRIKPPRLPIIFIPSTST
jgi:hypothetical protein